MTGTLLSSVKHVAEGRFSKQQGQVRFKHRLVVLDHPEIVPTLLKNLLG